jgi:hypothetical protein
MQQTTMLEANDIFWISIWLARKSFGSGAAAGH